MNKADIQNDILKFLQDNLLQNSLRLFKTLGYTTERQYKVNSNEHFKEQFLLNALNEDKALYTEWKNVQFLFELQPNDLNSDETEITGGRVGDKDIEAYWFYAIELKGDSYTKKQLSDITREINKVRTIPAFILFKYADKLTLSIIDRRLHKRNSNKDVLEKVVLIKDININDPHRAHIDILEDLSFEKIKSKYNVSDFVGLHENWLRTLSISELNKEFYKELSNWFFWAVDNCQMSKNNDHLINVMFCIRMVTRIIFNWFIKEKGLVSEKIFDKQTYLNLLKPEYREQGDLYYKTILQNLFFGCLSMPMEERRFRNKTGGAYGQNGDRNVNIYYRYEKYFNNSQDFINLVSDIPFINGGLFECLDDKDNVDKDGDPILIDCFTDYDKENPKYKNFLNIPDDIFFMENEKSVDISAHFDGESKYKNAQVKGLFAILNKYKFTIDETTPIEEEIALDPELLGRVFENLLAAHNPETKTSARKSTGSYYTPREIVDYMCEQSLINYLKTKVESLNIENIDNKLEQLMSYSEIQPFQKEEEVDELIKAVNEVKILDPACGSGAFPMGLLHKLVHVLSKLDPHNEKWKAEQLKNITDPVIRQEMEDAFKENNLDYSRKLYLIQNCIYGVDIQPMATQISRLRFFISLIVDEKVDKDKDNMGIYALPNLETKFVAANTLIGLDAQEEHSLFASDLKSLKDELSECRKEYFNARKREKKNTLRKRDKELREKIIKKAEDMHFEVEKTAKLVSWNPYAKDKKSEWFDPKWMFNVEKFDIVIANPPYVEFKNLPQSTKDLLKNYQTTNGKYDLYVPFIERGLELLLNEGQLNYICPTRFMTRDYGASLRKLINNDYCLNSIVDFSDIQIFDNAMTYTGLFMISKEIKDSKFKYSKFKSNINNSSLLSEILHNPNNYKNYIECNNYDISYLKNDSWYFHNQENENLLLKIKNKTNSLKECTDGIYQGIATGKDEVFMITKSEIDNYKITDKYIHKILKGKDISTYIINWSNKYVIYPYTENGKVIDEEIIKITDPGLYNYLLDNREKLKGRSYFDKSPKKWYELWNQRNLLRFKQVKIITLDNASKNSFAIDTDNYTGTTTTYSLILKDKAIENYHYVLAVLNSSLMNYYHKNNTIPQAGGFYRYQAIFINDLPIKIVDQKIKTKFSNKIKQLLNNIDNKEILLDIDVMVYKLYELTYDEIKTIDPNFSMSEQDYNNYKL